MRLATIFWKTCPDQIGAALIANLMLKSMALKAELTEKLQLAGELIANARFVYFIVEDVCKDRLLHTRSPNRKRYQ